MADSYSGYFDFKKLKHTTSLEVINVLKEWFAVHGIPFVLWSDNGPQYTSKLFVEFKNEWNFKHHTSSPHFPRGNGFAERHVQVAKNMLRKCSLDKSDVQLALLHHRNTQRNEKLGAPAERLMGRMLRSNLPTTNEQLKQKIINDVPKELNRLREVQRAYAEVGSKPAAPFQIGDKVRMRQGHRAWISATVVNKANRPRSFIIKTTDGRTFRRNTSHIHKSRTNIISDRVAIPASSSSSLPSSLTSLTSAPQPRDAPNTASSSSANPAVVVTRSGRVSKPVQRLGV